MAITAVVNDGKLEYDYTDSAKEKEQAIGSDLGYDQFLQLLCAEMQYQDPLEPTSNTDYVAQLATFSQLEATLSMQTTTQNSMASDLVGKQVILSVPNESTGVVSTVAGKVDYVMYQAGKAYLCVNDNLYSIDYLDTVADSEYYEANSIALTIRNMLSQFPEVDRLSTVYKGALSDVRELYDSLTDYQKSFVSEDDLKKLTNLETKMEELVKLEEQKAKNAAENFSEKIKALPTEEELTAEDKEALEELRSTYDDMSDYQKGFISEDDLSTLESLEAKMATLVSA